MSARGFVLALLLTGCVTANGHDPAAQSVANTDCYTCHKAAFQDPANTPVHNATDQPPADCSDCHSVRSWIPGGRHPENKFPIKTGKHDNIDCADCHDVTLGSSVHGDNVSCIGCHEHDQARMVDKHSDVGGFSWDPSRPAFCRDCHPTGRGGD